MMFILDTHVWLWSLLEPQKLESYQIKKFIGAVLNRK